MVPPIDEARVMFFVVQKNRHDYAELQHKADKHKKGQP
jgi:hypothetical protein